MRRILERRAVSVDGVAFIALVVAMAGTGYAATKLLQEQRREQATQNQRGYLEEDQERRRELGRLSRSP